MNSESNYYLLRKNNSLQTIDKLIHPCAYLSKDKVEATKLKQQLELHYLRVLPIHFHFDHIEAPCDEAIIDFDNFLKVNYGFSFLTNGFDHRQKYLNGNMLYDMQFPKSLSDQALVTIQKRLDKFHFELSKQTSNNKVIIVFNPWNIDFPLRDSEISKLQDFFDTEKAARNYIDTIIEGQFDLGGSILTVGKITRNELTAKTIEILTVQPDFTYESGMDDDGQKFIASVDLAEINDGMKTLLDLYASVGKKPYEIVTLE